jgi:hypothetical protein
VLTLAPRTTLCSTETRHVLGEAEDEEREMRPPLCLYLALRTAARKRKQLGLTICNSRDVKHRDLQCCARKTSLGAVAVVGPAPRFASIQHSASSFASHPASQPGSLPVTLLRHFIVRRQPSEKTTLAPPRRFARDLDDPVPSRVCLLHDEPDKASGSWPQSAISVLNAGRMILEAHNVMPS